MSGKNNTLFCFVFFKEIIQHECGEQTQKDVGFKCYQHVHWCVRARVSVCVHICVVSIYIYCAARVKPAKRCVCCYEMFGKR